MQLKSSEYGKKYNIKGVKFYDVQSVGRVSTQGHKQKTDV